MKIIVEHDISISRISDLLCTALEGGSNYWYAINSFVEPPQIDFPSFEGDSVLAGPEVYRHLHYPLSEGGALIFEPQDPEDGVTFKTNRLDLNSIKEGLTVMSVKYPSLFNDFIQENDDTTTGDVFLQCCLFGEVIYC